jgi:hypothetical protein
MTQAAHHTSSEYASTRYMVTSVLAALPPDPRSEMKDHQIQQQAATAALIMLCPADPLQHMRAARIVAAHHAAMDCFRRGAPAEVPDALCLRLRGKAVALDRMAEGTLARLQGLSSTPRRSNAAAAAPVTEAHFAEAEVAVAPVTEAHLAEAAVAEAAVAEADFAEVPGAGHAKSGSNDPLSSETAATAQPATENCQKPPTTTDRPATADRPATTDQSAAMDRNSGETRMPGESGTVAPAPAHQPVAANRQAPIRHPAARPQAGDQVAARPPGRPDLAAACSALLGADPSTLALDEFLSFTDRLLAASEAPSLQEPAPKPRTA